MVHLCRRHGLSTGRWLALRARSRNRGAAQPFSDGFRGLLLSAFDGPAAASFHRITLTGLSWFCPRFLLAHLFDFMKALLRGRTEEAVFDRAADGRSAGWRARDSMALAHDGFASRAERAPAPCRRHEPEPHNTRYVCGGR
jgi:hypothetical protein